MSISALINTARVALNAQTQLIRVTGDNVANVNTPGYTRRRAEVVTTDVQPGTGVGTGVNIEEIIRVADQFLNRELVRGMGDRAYAEIREEFLKRAEQPFSVAGNKGTIGGELTSFFSAIYDLSTNPADLNLRSQVLLAGQNLVRTISTTYNTLAGLQREADTRIGTLVTEVNQLSQGIAELNLGIVQQETGSQQALTLRDQRDELMRQLGELVSFQSVDNPDGTNLLYLSNGFSLVNGTKSSQLGYVIDPSFENAPPNNFPPGLDGQALGHIVFDFGNGSQIDLTNVIRNGGSGEVAGLLSLRGVQPNPGTPTSTFDADGTIVEVAARVEAMTRYLLTDVNQIYLYATKGATASLSYDLDNNAANTVGDQAGFFSLFSFNNATAQANNGDIDNDGIPEAADLNAIIAGSGGAITNFSRILSFNVSDPRQFAAGRTDYDTVTAGVQGASSDAAGIDALIAERTAVNTFASPGTVTSFSTTTTLENFYGITVSTIGAASKQAQNELVLKQQREQQTAELQASVSGVSIDEEFSKLIEYQRAFQASARMIRTGDELFDEIIAIAG